MSWALAGQSLVRSTTSYDDAKKEYRMVRLCHLGQALAYHNFVCRKAHEFGDKLNGCTPFLLSRDKETRSKVKQLFTIFDSFIRVMPFELDGYPLLT